jgi:hypothetical protein
MKKHQSNLSSQKSSHSRQDLAGEVLLAIAEQASPRVRLSPAQIGEVELARAEARDDKFASDESMDALWKRFGV